MSDRKILNIVVAGIEYQNKWLLIRRERGDYIGKYALVGGKIEFGETIEEAIKREVKEETGLDIIWRGVKSVINERLIDKDTTNQTKQFFIILCHTTAKKNKTIPSREGELRWFSKEEIVLMKDQIIPSDYFMVTELLQKSNINQIIEVDMTQQETKLEITKFHEY